MKKLIFYTISIIAISLGLNYQNVFADEPEDVVYNITSSFQTTDFCGGSSSYTCSDYNYLIITSNIPISGINRQIALNISNTVNDSTVGQQTNISYNTSTELRLKIENTVTNIQSWLVNNLSQSESFTITLTASDSCPTCPVCPEPLDPNRSPVMDDFHNVFMNTMLSVIPITAIIFIVWFFIDMLSSLFFGRGK